MRPIAMCAGCWQSTALHRGTRLHAGVDSSRSTGWILECLRQMEEQ
jgi:hypothetical protein